MKKKLINIFRLVIVGLILLVFISPTGLSRIDLYTDSADYTDGGSFNISSDAYIDIWSVDGVNITGDMIVDGSLTLDSFLDMDFNDINNVNDLHVDNDVDVGNDLHVNDKIEHLGDSDTYLDFNGNQILFFVGGNQILNMQTTLATFGVDVDMDENLTVNNNATIDGDLTAGKNVNVTGGDLNVSDGNVYIHGTDNNAIYPYSLNVWNPGRAWSYIFIGNDEGGPNGGAFFGLEGAPGGDRFALYNWQAGMIRFLTDIVPSSGKPRIDILNNGNILIYQNLSIGQAGTGGGLLLKGENSIVQADKRGGFITWYHDFGLDGYTFVNTNSQLVFNDTAQNKVDDVGKAWIELDTGKAHFDGNVSVTENITGNVHHGEAYFHNHDGETLNFVSDIWYNLSFNASKNLNGFTWDGLGNLTCLVSGLYDVGYTACGSGQNNHVYHLAVGVNGIVDVNVSAHKKMAAGGDETDMGGSGFIQLTAGDYVSLMIRDHGGSGAGLYIHSNLNLVRIGD